MVSAFQSVESLKSFAISSLFATGRFSVDKLKKYEAGGGGDSGDDSIPAAAGAAGAGERVSTENKGGEDEWALDESGGFNLTESGNNDCEGASAGSIADEEDGGSDSDSSQAAAAAEAGAGADALGAGTARAAGPAAEGDKRVSIENNEDEASIAHAEARAPAPVPSVDGSELANGNGGVCHHGNQPMDVSAQKSACSAEGQEAGRFLRHAGSNGA